MKIKWTEEEEAKARKEYEKVSQEHSDWSFQSRIRTALDVLPQDRRRNFAAESVLPWNKTKTKKPRQKKQPKESPRDHNRFDSAIDALADAIAEDVESRVMEKVIDRISEKMEAARQRRLGVIRERASVVRGLNGDS